MKIATDTGFFLRYLEGNEVAETIWYELLAEQHTMLIPTIVLNEIFTHFFQRGVGDVAQSLLDLPTNTSGFEFIPLSADIATLSARYRVGMRLSTIDSIILSSALSTGCDLLVTSDSDLDQASVKNLIKVQLLSK